MKEYIKTIYERRFSEQERNEKIELWRIFISVFLSRHIYPQDSVLDIGGGYGEFINNINAKEKYLVDINPACKDYADSGVKVINEDLLSPGTHLDSLPRLDCIFISNFFEHLNTREEIIRILEFSYFKLRTDGRLIIIQPNFKYSYKEYFDFIDHRIPLTHISLKEALELVGFKVDVSYAKFLPFSVKGNFHSPLLLNIYLRLPLLWRIFGKQMFVKAIRKYIYHINT